MHAASRHQKDPGRGPAPRCEQRLRPNAFTLIELMVVIGLAAIIMAVGLPPFARAMRKEGLRKAVSDIVEGCSHARALAILQGVPAEMIIRAEDGQVSIRQLAAPNTGGSLGTQSEPRPPSASASFKANLPQDVAVKLLYVNFKDRMELPEAHVRFFPNGTSDEFTIILTSLRAEQQVSLDVVTGLADVKIIR